MNRNEFSMRRQAAVLVAATVSLAAAIDPARAVDTCITPDPGDVYYVAYQNNPAGPEYIVDLGSKDQFLTATTKLTFADIRVADFATVFAPTAPNLFLGFFGVRNPASRDAIVSANGPKDFFALDHSSIPGAAEQIDSWASGLPQFASEVGGGPCSLNAGRFPGRVFGSYQDTLNGINPQGSISGNLVWSVESRLSNTTGARTNTNKIKFYDAQSNPAAGTSSRASLGYFKGFTDGRAEYWPDFDGDLLPDVAIGSDPEADKCTQVASTDQTDVDGDNHSLPCDCQDGNAAVWGQVPAEVPGVTVAADKQTISWTPPTGFFGTSPVYDVFRASQSVGGAVPAWTCFSPNQAGASAIDGTTPPSGTAFLYLVRAQTGCGNGTLNRPGDTDQIGDRDAAAPSCP
jgi:hypothetical protein